MLLAQVTTTEEAKRQAEKQHMFQSILEAIRDEVSELKVLSDLTLRKAELLVEGRLVVIVLHLMHEIERIWFKMILLVLRHAGRSHDGIHTWNTFKCSIKINLAHCHAPENDRSGDIRRDVRRSRSIEQHSRLGVFGELTG
jgi:hypothetical protein